MVGESKLSAIFLMTEFLPIAGVLGELERGLVPLNCQTAKPKTLSVGCEAVNEAITDYSATPPSELRISSQDMFDNP